MKKKILVNSPFVQSDGWGRSARDYLKLFMSTDNEVRANPMVLSNQLVPKDQLPKWLPENGNGFNPEVIFNQALPEYFSRYPKVKNIGSFFSESRHLENTGWVESCNNMDEIWVATQQEKINLEESNVKSPIHVVRNPMEFADISDKHPELEEAIGDKFAFYFIGEWGPRKNINDLILAYWREFKREENVILVIKTNAGNTPVEQLSNFVRQQIMMLQQTFRIYGYAHYYPEIFVIPENISDEDMVKLHNSCDCFVTAAYGESLCRPLVEAAYREKPVICPAGIGAVDPDLVINTVESWEVPCVVNTPPTPYLYTSKETWMKVDVLDLEGKMRDAFDNKLEHNSKDKVKDLYSYDRIAETISNIL